MRLKAIACTVLLLLFINPVSGQEILVEGLQEEGVNRTFTDDGMRFTTSYLNITIPFKNATYPDQLHDDLKKWTYSTTIKENSSQLDFQSEWSSSALDALAGRKVNEKISVKKGETKSTLYDGKLEDDNGQLAVEVSAEASYENLAITYGIVNTTGSNGTKVAEYTDYYRGSNPSIVPIAWSNVRTFTEDDGDKVQAVDTSIDNTYGDKENYTVVMAYWDNYTFQKLDHQGSTTSISNPAKWHSEAETRAKNQNLSEDLLISNESQYQFKAYNITVPADTEDTLTAEIITGEDNPQAGVTTYILGSIGGTTTYTSSSGTVSGQLSTVFYRLNESSGTTVYDYSGNNNDGTTKNSPTQGVSGAPNTPDEDLAYSFNVSNSEYVEGVTNPLSDNFTLTAWANLNGTGSTENALWGDFSGGGSVIFSDRNMDGDLGLWLEGSEVDSGPTIPTSEWVFFAVKFNDASNTVTFFKNKSTTTQTLSVDFTGSSNGLDVGTIGDGSQGVTGEIDNPQAYNQLLTDSEVNNIFENGEPNSAPSIDGESSEPANWNNSGNDFIDISINATEPDGDSMSSEYKLLFANNGTEILPYSSMSSTCTASDFCETSAFKINSSGEDYSLWMNVSDGKGGYNISITNQTNVVTNTDTAPTTSLDSPSDGSIFNGGQVIDFNASATDDLNLVNATLYTNETGSWANRNTTTFNGTQTSADAPFSRRLDPGTYKYNYEFWDNNSQSDFGGSNFTFKITDETKPSISFNPSTTDSGSTSQDWVLLNFTASDNEAVDTVEESFDGTNSSLTNNIGDNWWENHTALSDGSYDILGWATDTASNIAKTVTRTITIDTTPPSTSDNYTASGWQRKNQTTVSLDATDTTTNVSEISYRDNGGSWTTANPNTTANISGDGNHTLEYNSTDFLGNKESTQTEYVALDATAPNLTIHTPSNTTYKDQSTIDLDVTGSDATTSVADWYYTQDGGSENSFTPNTSLTWTDGQHSIQVKAGDNVSNNATKTVHFTVNLTLPDGYVKSLPSGKAVGLRSSPATNMSNSSNMKQGVQDLVFGEGLGTDLSAQLRINLSAANVTAQHLVVDTNRTTKKSLLYNTSTINHVKEKTLLIPRVDDTGKVHICPTAENLSETGLGCGDGYNVSSGNTVNNVTVSEVAISGQNYYEATGVNGTGGVEVKSSSSDGGGGGGGGGGSSGSTTGDTEENETTVLFNKPLYSLAPGQTHTKIFQVENTLQQQETLEIHVPQSSRACQFFQVETSINSGRFGVQGRYQLDSAFSNNHSFTTTIDVRIEMPSREVFNEIANGSKTITCTFKTAAEKGKAEPLKIQVQPAGIVAQLQARLPIDIPTLSLFNMVCLNTEKTSAGDSTCPEGRQIDTSIGPTASAAAIAAATVVGGAVVAVVFGQRLLSAAAGALSKLV